MLKILAELVRIPVFCVIDQSTVLWALGNGHGQFRSAQARVQCQRSVYGLFDKDPGHRSVQVRPEYKPAYC